MADLHETGLASVVEAQPDGVQVAPVTEVVPEATPPVEENGSPSEQEKTSTWHAEAGRKGAFRIRDLIRLGKQYEQEHGLTSGRQRLRQLIAEGKLYEQEHGLRPTGRRGRGTRPRVSNDQLVRTLLHTLLRLAKPSVRADLLRVLEALNRE